MFSCIIIDDEHKARLLLRNMLSDTAPGINVLAECDDLPSGVRAIRQYKPDVIFLDIEMPGNSGIEILNFFNEDEISFQIVFTTGYSEYALQAFRLSALDYLMKPINPLVLAETVDRIKNGARQQPQAYQALYENLSLGRDINEKCLLVNLSNSTKFVRVKDIIMLQAEGSYTALHLRGGERLIASKNLRSFEEKLSGFSNFFRSHKSFVINLQYVRECNRSEGLVMLDGDLEAYLSMDKSDTFLRKMEALC